MCGIAGIIAPNANRYKKQLACMVSSLRHRGPDASGMYFFDNCALGHTRLSIVDIEGGTQPMLTDDEHLGVTFNGEIYGFRNIRNALAGYPFRTKSDTEVILALYEKYGFHMMSHLSGMFSFALWDDMKQQLFCARDRFGEKPLYYALGVNGEFVFASEIKTILASKLVYPVLSQAALVHYLQKLYVHPTQTIYKNISILPPASTLTYRGKKIKVERYWYLPEPCLNIQLSDAVEEFQELFKRAIQKQLIADVEVGAFLSGGLDSASIVMVGSQLNPSLRTYSFGFRDNRNELPYAQDVARLYGTNHSELIDEKRDLDELFVRMNEVYDEPFADSSNIPTYLICKTARKYGKVILTGDGGDELLAGYDGWYKPLKLMELASPQKTSIPARPALFLARVAGKLGMRISQEWLNYCQTKVEFQKYGSIIEAHRARCIFTNSDLHILGFKENNNCFLEKYDWKSSGTVDDALRMDIENYMPGDILVKTDRAAMAHGLELRAPFLDVDLASFCIALPSELKITTTTSKVLLREAFSHKWPESIRKRNKQGFGAPIDEWLRCDSLRYLKEQYLNDPQRKIFGIISFKGSRPFVKQNSYKTWSLLVLALWAEQHSFEIDM